MNPSKGRRLVATPNAFGNALGQSLGESANGTGDSTREAVLESVHARSGDSDLTVLPTGNFRRLDRAQDPYVTGYQDSSGAVVTDLEMLENVIQRGPLLADASQSSRTFKAAADGFARRATEAYAAGRVREASNYLQYASEYFTLHGETELAAQRLEQQRTPYALPPAAPGVPRSDLNFEVKLGGAAYAGLGGNFEFTANINLSRPGEFSVTEWEWGVGVGIGYKAKLGFAPLRDVEATASLPIGALYSSDSRQASGTAAVSSKVVGELAFPLGTLSLFERKIGIQSPLAGVRPSPANTGIFSETKTGELKASPFINWGATGRFDLFNSSYKK